MCVCVPTNTNKHTAEPKSMQCPRGRTSARSARSATFKQKPLKTLYYRILELFKYFRRLLLLYFLLFAAFFPSPFALSSSQIQTIKILKYLRQKKRKKKNTTNVNSRCAKKEKYKEKKKQKAKLTLERRNLSTLSSLS